MTIAHRLCLGKSTASANGVLWMRFFDVLVEFDVGEQYLGGQGEVLRHALNSELSVASHHSFVDPFVFRPDIPRYPTERQG